VPRWHGLNADALRNSTAKRFKSSQSGRTEPLRSLGRKVRQCFGFDRCPVLEPLTASLSPGKQANLDQTVRGSKAFLPQCLLPLTIVVRS
jgi:hypothetical protein